MQPTFRKIFVYLKMRKLFILDLVFEGRWMALGVSCGRLEEGGEASTCGVAYS